MVTAIEQELSELQQKLNREREVHKQTFLSRGELWQPPFCMSDLFAIIPGCSCEPIRIDFQQS